MTNKKKKLDTRKITTYVAYIAAALLISIVLLTQIIKYLDRKELISNAYNLQDVELVSAIKDMQAVIETIRYSGSQYPLAQEFKAAKFWNSSDISNYSALGNNIQTGKIIITSSPEKNKIAYELVPKDCNNVSVVCTGYTLTAITSGKQADGSYVYKVSALK